MTTHQCDTREHAQMWPILDTVDLELADGISDDVMRTACRQRFIQLKHHNPKEEHILYPQVDHVVDKNASIRVRELLDTGQVPAGWTCQHLRRAWSWMRPRIVGPTTQP